MRKGKILGIKNGYNPNSSSLGINLGPLLIIGSVVCVFIPLISIYISRRIKHRKAAIIEAGSRTADKDV